MSELWDRLTSAQPDPPHALVLITAAIALAAVIERHSWRVLRNVVTIAHEGGHAAMALLTGRRLRGVRLHSDTSGLTVSSGRPTGPGMVLTLIGGYLAPSVLGLGAALLLADGRITLLLWTLIGLLGLLLLAIRNVYGVVSVLVTGGTFFALSWFATPQVQGACAYVFTWFLLIAAPRPVGELQAMRRRRGMHGSDADQLGRLTHTGALFWIGVFGLLTIAAAALGARLLVPWPFE